MTLWRWAPLTLLVLSCLPEVPVCGDGVCDAANGESCGTCAPDCGPCLPPVPVCGDLFCDGLHGESCSTCAQDCGSCAPLCLPSCDPITGLCSACTP